METPQPLHPVAHRDLRLQGPSTGRGQLAVRSPVWSPVRSHDASTPVRRCTTLGPGARRSPVSVQETDSPSLSIGKFLTVPLGGKSPQSCEIWSSVVQLTPGGAGTWTRDFSFRLSVSPRKWDSNGLPSYLTDCWGPDVIDRDWEALCKPHGGGLQMDSSGPVFFTP